MAVLAMLGTRSNPGLLGLLLPVSRLCREVVLLRCDLLSLLDATVADQPKFMAFRLMCCLWHVAPTCCNDGISSRCVVMVMTRSTLSIVLGMIPVQGNLNYIAY